jgi:radical SAM protein with 4Fe4S-binding SPASM domain
MSLQNFKTYLGLINQYNNLTQIALGVGDIDANPDIWEIMAYVRENDLVPNITINGANMTPKYYDNLFNFCGAVSVSHYDDDDICFKAVKELTDRIYEHKSQKSKLVIGYLENAAKNKMDREFNDKFNKFMEDEICRAHSTLNAVNIHKILAEETIDSCLDLITKAKTDERLSRVNSIIFLLAKEKGSRNTFHHIKSRAKYRELLKYALIEDNGEDKRPNKIGLGFDSCGCYNVLSTIKDDPNFNYEELRLVMEPCEATLFSIYVNVDGNAYPCSFLEKQEREVNLNYTSTNNLLNDIWFSEQFKNFRKNLLATKNYNALGCRECPVYDLRLSD